MNVPHLQPDFGLPVRMGSHRHLVLATRLNASMGWWRAVLPRDAEWLDGVSLESVAVSAFKGRLVA